MGGPKQNTSFPAYSKDGDVWISRARVLSVDKVKWTCRVQTSDGRIYDSIAVNPTHLTAKGSGQFHLPETDSLVMICRPSTDVTPFIMSGATVSNDDSDDPSDRRQNRPVLNEGDMLLGSSDTASIILRRGGVLEIGASESAKRLYIPLTNLIREFSQNWEHESGGGRMSMKCRDTDESFGADLTPAEFQLQWNEFCEDDLPMIDLRMGRVKAEDDQQIINSPKGAIVYSFNINRRFRVWIDKYGNFQKLTHGGSYESYVGPRVARHDKSLTWIIRGLCNQEMGSRRTAVAEVDYLEVGRDKITTVGGNVAETISGGVSRKVNGSTTEETGSVSRVVSGSITENVQNNYEQTIAASRSVNVGQSFSETIGSTSQTLVANGENASDAWTLLVKSGKASLHNVLGKNEFSVGPTPSAATCKITQKNSGAIVLESSLGAARVEVNQTGVRISTPGGEVSLDAAGTTQLGPAGRGNVVTTTTHPVDFITGLPILGSSSVQAGGVPSPGPSVLASTFVKDVTK